MEVLHQLSEYALDQHEVLAAVRSAFPSSAYDHPTRTWTFRSDGNQSCVVRLNKHLSIRTVDMAAPQWEKLRTTLESDCALPSFVGRTALASYRRIEGFAQAPGWIQLRPLGTMVPDLTLAAQAGLTSSAGRIHPFAVEVMCRRSGLMTLHVHRIARAIQEAAWLLTAFLDTPVIVQRQQYAFAYVDGGISLVNCALDVAMPDAADDSFSDVGHLRELSPVESDAYYEALGLTSSDFRVPDLVALKQAFNRLSAELRVRFLRACSALSNACELSCTDSTIVVSSVAAIECLLPAGDRCTACRSHTGVTRNFRDFVDSYVRPLPEVRSLFYAIYAKRSELAHGAWNFEVDEPHLGLQVDQLSRLVAWSAAKRGLIRWLLEHAKTGAA